MVFHYCSSVSVSHGSIKRHHLPENREHDIPANRPTSVVQRYGMLVLTISHNKSEPEPRLPVMFHLIYLISVICRFFCLIMDHGKPSLSSTCKFRATYSAVQAGIDSEERISIGGF